MTKEEIKISSLVSQIYIDKKPPEYLGVEVTRDNYDLVAEWLNCPEMIIKKSVGSVFLEVTFKNIYALNEKGENVDELTVSFPNEPGAKHVRRLFILRDEKYDNRLVTQPILENKYINIPQEESVIE